MFTYFTNKKASPAPPLGQEKPMSYHRNPSVSRERERERERVNRSADCLCLHTSWVIGFSVVFRLSTAKVHHFPETTKHFPNFFPASNYLHSFFLFLMSALGNRWRNRASSSSVREP